MITPLSRWWEGARVEVYTVHEPPEAPTDRIDRAERIVFLRDGFTWAAALLGPFWLAARRLWVPLVLFIAIAGGLVAVLSAIGASETWIAIVLVAALVVLGFEAASIERWSLDRAGWSELGTVSGRNLSECERRFFESWLPAQPALASRGSAAAVPAGAIAPGDARRPARGWRRLLGSRS